MQDQNRMSIQCNPTLENMAEMIPDVEYSSRWGLKLALLRPWNCALNRKYPLVVFVQGSAWTFPNIYMELPQLADLARKGYVVATVTHRNCLEGNAWPAYLQDVKTAIRFLRAHHKEYGIDPEHVGIWGTSSGGNAAMLVGLTAEAPEFGKEEYPDESDAVDFVVNCFGPTDIKRLTQNEKMALDFQDIFLGLSGEQNPDEVMEKMSPLLRVENGRKYPAFLLLNGDQDELVPFEQNERMHQRLLEAHAESRLVRVYGAPHEGSFWSKQCLEIIHTFIEEHI